MADRFGGLSLPVAPPTTRAEMKRAPGDPGLVVLGSFLATVLVALCGDAWAALDAGKSQLGAELDLGATGKSVRRIFFFNPTERQFHEADLPALFLFRGGDRGNFERYTQDDYRETSSITAWWAVRQVTGVVEQERDPFVNAIGKAAADCVRVGYHPSWVLDADREVLDGIATAIAGQTSPWTASGAALDGALANAVLQVPRPVVIQTAAVNGAYTAGTVVIRGTVRQADGTERAWMDTIEITNANGGESLQTVWRFSRVTSIDFPGQVSTDARFMAGYADSPEVRQGSRMKRAARFPECLPRRPGEVRNISMPSGVGGNVVLRVYEMQFEVLEDLELDPLSRGAVLNGGADATYQIPDVGNSGTIAALPFAQLFALSTF